MIQLAQHRKEEKSKSAQRLHKNVRLPDVDYFTKWLNSFYSAVNLVEWKWQFGEAPSWFIIVQNNRNMRRAKHEVSLHSFCKLESCVRMSIQIMIGHQMDIESLVFISVCFSVSFDKLVVQLYLEEFQLFDEFGFWEIRALKILQLIHKNSENWLNSFNWCPA